MQPIFSYLRIANKANEFFEKTKIAIVGLKIPLLLNLLNKVLPSRRVLTILELVPVNLFHATGFLLYPFTTSENLWFPDIFRGYRKTPVT